jgi:hypothetical protein
VYDLVGAQVTAEGGRAVPNPFSLEPGAIAGFLVTLADEITVDARQIIPGRININTAPPAVLRTIPGVDQQLIDRIIAARGDGQDLPGRPRYHAAWLVAEGWMKIEWMKQLEPYITARGDVRRGQIISFFDSPVEVVTAANLVSHSRQKFVRREVVIDDTQQPPSVIYRRDLSNLGRGFSSDVLTGTAHPARVDQL